MLTILLEVKRSDGIQGNRFYNPAADGFKKYPRSENGIKKAIKDLMSTVQRNEEWISDYKFVIYEGRYDYYKNMSPLCVIDRIGNILQLTEKQN